MSHSAGKESFGLKLKGPTHEKATQVNPVAPRIKQIVGCLLVFAGAACFYLSSAAVRWSKQHVLLSPAFFVFARFFLGFAIVSLSMIVKQNPIAPRRYSLLIGRALANTAAVYCFYTAVSVTSLAQANILNMTYPVFVALFAWVTLKKQRDPFMTLALLVAFGGIFLVLVRGPLVIGWSHLWGLASGVCGAVAILTLNASRRWHDTETILFYLFGIGTVLIWFLFPETIYWPSGKEAYFLILCSGLSISGQYCMTYGHRYVTAVEGSIVASTRILIAAFLGPVIATDPPLTLRGWIGAGLIFAANLALALRKKQPPTPN
jgi:drug/metabolite transporter (DMT)-like permease